MDQAVPVQVTQGRGNGRTQPDAFADVQAPALPVIIRQGAGAVLFRNDDLAGADIIAKFHHIIKISGGIVAAHLEDVHQPIVQPRDRFEFQHAVKLTLKRPALLERPRIHNLHRAVGPQNIPGQPHLAAAAAADDPDKFVIRNDERDGRRGGRS